MGKPLKGDGEYFAHIQNIRTTMWCDTGEGNQTKLTPQSNVSYQTTPFVKRVLSVTPFTKEMFPNKKCSLS